MFHVEHLGRNVQVKRGWIARAGVGGLRRERVAGAGVQGRGRSGEPGREVDGWGGKWTAGTGSGWPEQVIEMGASGENEAKG